MELGLLYEFDVPQPWSGEHPWGQRMEERRVYKENLEQIAFADKQGTVYAVVVNGDLDKDAEVPVNVPDTTRTLTDLVSGQTVALSDKEAAMFMPLGRGFKQAQVKLGPGNGTILRLDR